MPSITNDTGRIDEEVRNSSSMPEKQSEPDMGAVYVLLGCLAVSGLVVFGILVYCAAHCCRRKLFEVRRSSPTAARLASGNIDRCYVALKHSRMNGATASNGRSPTIEDDSSSNSPVTVKESCPDFGDLGKASANFLAAPALTNNNCIKNGATTVADKERENSRDDLDEEAEKRSVMRYDVGYSKTNAGCFRGTLTFALRYDCIHRALMVHVVRACRLPAKDRCSPRDPYVKIYLCPERKCHGKTKIARNTLDPEFNEMFSFDAPYNGLSHRMIQFTVYDFERIKRHDLIGTVIMRDLFEKSDLYSWTEITMHIIANIEKDDYGDLLFYLTYDDSECKLVFCIAKAYNLRPMDITGASDPYIKIIHFAGAKRVKTKKTTMKRANLHPVYNETLTFDLNDAAVENSSFLIKVMDWDRIGNDDLLGCCVLGADSPTFEGREQWRQCLAMRRKSIGMWHSLLADVPADFANATKL